MKHSSLRRLVGTGLTAAMLGVSAVAVAAPAGAANSDTAPDGARRHRMHLTDDQKQCLKDEGISRPIRPLTREKVAALKAAAEACDITRPNHGGDRKSARPS